MKQAKHQGKNGNHETNFLLICADQFSPRFLGCYGHPFIETPNIDKLAASGARFTNAYTCSPVCVPARGSFATGRYVHEIGTWDNIHPYEGTPRSWMHEIRDQGHTVISFGKLHFRSEEDDTGFTRQVVPMHVLGGVGDLFGALRDPLPSPQTTSKIATQIGAGDSGYIRYDKSVSEAACEWLEQESPRDTRPWAAFVSFACPHQPLIAPQEYFDRYPLEKFGPPRESGPGKSPLHPWLKKMRHVRNDDDFFDDETRKIAQASYAGLCSFVDDKIGEVLSALERSGQKDRTQILFFSDHGECLGTREVWGKSNMYEEASKVPMILAGPDVAAGTVIEEPVETRDIYKTALDTLNIVVPDASAQTGTSSLLQVAREGGDPDRVAFSEYHAAYSPSACYMIRKRDYKYIYYVGFEPELFDLSRDPEESRNLAGAQEFADIQRELHADLINIADPEETDRQAKLAQAKLIKQNGGRKAIEERGSTQGTPAPGEPANYIKQ